jgi:hypothetical protein
MNTEHLPGFTAENSVYLTRAQYNVTTPAFSGTTNDIRPQRAIQCGDIRTSIEIHFHRYGLAIAAGDHQAALVELGIIETLQNLSSLC